MKDTVNKDGEDDFKDVEMRELDKGSNKVSSDVVMYEEETRMSAETSTSSRAQTPAKQVSHLTFFSQINVPCLFLFNSQKLYIFSVWPEYVYQFINFILSLFEMQLFI